MDKEMRKVASIVFIAINFIPACNHMENYKGVNVWLTLQPQTVFEGEPVSLECRYNRTSPNLAFNHLEWFFNDVKVAEYDENFELNSYIENNFELDTNGTHSYLRLPGVTSASAGNYTCRVQFDDKSSKQFYRNESTALLRVQAVLLPRASMHLSNENGPLDDGGTVTIGLRNQPHIFFLKVTSTIPASTKCYLGEELLEIYESTMRGDGPVNTTSIFLINSTESHNKQLKCTANLTNSKGPLSSVQVTLEVDASTDMGCMYVCTSIWPWLSIVLIITAGILGGTILGFLLRHIMKVYNRRAFRGRNHGESATQGTMYKKQAIQILEVDSDRDLE